MGLCFGGSFVGQETVEDEVAFAFEEFVLFRAVSEIVVNDLRYFHTVCHEIVSVLLAATMICERGSRRLEEAVTRKISTPRR